MTQIIIFTPINDLKTLIIKRLEKIGYGVFIDGERGNNVGWLGRCLEECYFFKISDEKHVLSIENFENFEEGMVDILIEPRVDIEKIKAFLNGVISGDYYDVEDVLPKSSIQALIEEESEDSEGDVEMDKNSDNEYHFYLKYMNNSCLYQVTKPYTDRPYTCVNYDFKNRGHIDFFTDLFICPSWGVCGQDIMFLKKCWENLDMYGIFDLEELMRVATEECTPQDGTCPRPEPIVYRKSMDEVIELLNKRNGFYSFLDFFKTGGFVPRSKSILFTLK